MVTFSQIPLLHFAGAGDPRIQEVGCKPGRSAGARDCHASATLRNVHQRTPANLFRAKTSLNERWRTLAKQAFFILSRWRPLGRSLLRRRGHRSGI